MARNIVLLVDDHLDWRTSVKRCMPDIKILEAQDLPTAIRLIEERHLEIRVGIFDLCLPSIDETSVPAAKRLRELARMEVLIFGITAEESYMSHFHVTVDGRPLCNEILSKDMAPHIFRALNRLVLDPSAGQAPASDKWLSPRNGGQDPS